MSGAGRRLLLRGGALPDGTAGDIAIDPEAGTIVEVAPALDPEAGDTVEDCTGMVVVPAPAEPHAHLDKALSAMAAANPAGDLAGAIAAWHAHWPKLTHGDLVERATTAVEAMVSNGTTAIRTHVDVGAGLGLRALDALVEVRAGCRTLVDMQIVALVATPLTGGGGAANRRLLRAAVDAGADVVGGCPYRDPDPAAATALVLDVAAGAGLPVDLHTDETLDPAVLTVRDLARQVGERGPGAGVTASHCVSLAVQAPAVQEKVAELVAAAGVAVVALPQTNLYLQARAVATAPPRGLTAVAALHAAGVTVAAGADNARDPFCAMGRLDATETAALMVMAAHLTPGQAWHACSAAARTAMGLSAGGLVPGAPAELLALPGGDLADAVASAAGDRITVHRGHVVARTTTTRTLCGMPEPLEV